MAKNVEVAKKETVKKEVVFNKQQVVKTVVSKGTNVILSGKVRLYSDKHDFEGFDNISLTISEDEGSDIDEMTVQEVLDCLEVYQGEKPDLTKLTVDDFLASIVHENLA